MLSPEAQRRLPYVTAIVRIIFGLIVAHQFVDMFGVAVITGERANLNRWLCAIMAAAGLSLACGFLTPLCLLVLIFRGYAYYPIVANLGNMVSVMVCWLLLLQHAGKVWSLDALLFRRAQNVMPDPFESPRFIAASRAFVLTLYWIVCVQAMVFHFEDGFWQQGHVLQVALVMNYFCDHAALVNDFREAAPSWYVTFCCVGLVVQSFWELFIIPLMYFRWGRVFVILQGIGFFVMSVFCLNLGYLPVMELCFWALLFGHLIPSRTRPPTTNESAPVHGFSLVGKLLVAVMIIGMVTSLARFLLFLAPTKLRSITPVARVYNKLPWINWAYGIREVSVFNRGDLSMGNYYFVVYEIDEEGKIVRLVPYQDAEGGRLRMLRNDLFYFNYSLQWQRAGRTKCFENDDLRTPTKYTFDLIDRVVLLDSLFADDYRPRRYRVDFYDRHIVTDPLPAGWSPSQYRHSLVVSFTESNVAAHANDRKLTFDLPPGHQVETGRSQQALERGTANK